MKSFNQKSSRLLLALAACAALCFAACSNSSDNTIPTGATGGATPTTNGGGTTTTTETPVTYTITVGSFENGTVAASATSAASGTTVTLTATPASGYALSSISVTAADSSAVTLSGSGNARTFTMPAQNVTVSASFILAYTALPAGTDGTYGTSGTYVTFGSWPQTIKADGVTVDESAAKSVGAFTYYKGDDGEWYAKLAENACYPSYHYSDGTTVGQGGTNYKYFKVEPIKWRVLTNDYSGKKLLLAESILVNCRYYDTYDEDRGGIMPNNYKESRIRAFLNGLSYNKSGTTNSEFSGKGFLQIAFTTSEQEAIETTAVDNSARSTNPDANATKWNSGNNQYACADTSDKIFLLSMREVTKSDYGFAAYNTCGAGSSRIRKTTDYAKASGAGQNSTAGMGGWWWLRSPYYYLSDGARGGGYDGAADSNYTVGDSPGGVVPALSIN